MISILVSVYNMKDYLVQCLDSVLAQTYTDYECILVDDGSKDNSLEMCNEYAAKDKRFIVVHQENGGLSAARNTGLKHAKGDLITFLDPDDWIHPEYLQRLVELKEKYNADMSAVSFVKTSDRNYQPIKAEVTVKEYTGRDFVDNMNTLRHPVGDQVWARLYDKKAFDGKQFPPRKDYEDVHVIPQTVYPMKKVVYSTEILYYYFQRVDGISRLKTRINSDLLEAYIINAKFARKNNDKKLLRQMKLFFFTVHLEAVYRVKKYHAGNKELLGKLKALKKEMKRV